MSRRTPGGDGELALRRFGMALYDLLMPQLQPGELGLREIFRDFALLEPLAERPLTILVIADDPASFPGSWCGPMQLVEEEDSTQAIEEEDFLAARFALSHRYGRQQLHMFNETPLRRMQLAHYGQHVDQLPRWRQALGGDQRVELLPTTGELLVAVSRTATSWASICCVTRIAAAPVLLPRRKPLLATRSNSRLKNTGSASHLATLWSPSAS